VIPWSIAQARHAACIGQDRQIRLASSIWAQCGPYRADWEEEVCIGVTAGGIVTPGSAHGHRPNFDLAWRTTVPGSGESDRMAYSLPSHMPASSISVAVMALLGVFA
jgi:hypothetical protein